METNRDVVLSMAEHFPRSHPAFKAIKAFVEEYDGLKQQEMETRADLEAYKSRTVIGMSGLRETLLDLLMFAKDNKPEDPKKACDLLAICTTLTMRLTAFARSQKIIR